MNKSENQRIEVFFDSFEPQSEQNWMGPKKDASHEYTIQKDIGFVQLQSVDWENTSSKIVYPYIYFQGLKQPLEVPVNTDSIGN